MTTKPTDSQKLELLYKKYLGYPDAYPGTLPSVEAPGSARQKVFSSLQILPQTVPSIAPSVLTVDNTFTGGSNIRYTNVDYPHIVKYVKLPLTSVKPNTSFTYSYTGLPNLLTNVIPTNFDGLGSYAIYVFLNNIQVSPDKWVLDVDAGYITFFDADVTQSVSISFWRYEGEVGLNNWVGNIIPPTKGGTGVNNGTKTITLDGNLTTSGNHTTTLTTTGNTNVTLPTSGTLAVQGESIVATQMPALTGDVTTTAGSVDTTITNGAVSLSKMAQLQPNTIIGNNTASSDTPLALSTDNVKSMLGLAITSGAIPFGNSTSTGLDVDSTKLSFDNDTSTLNVQNVTVSGNLTVNGEQTILNVTRLEIEDPIIQVNKTETLANDQKAGIEVYRGDGITTQRLIFDESDDKWKAGLNGSETNIILGSTFTQGSIPYADASGNLTQNNSGLYYSGTNLGIGTSSPQSKVHIVGSDNVVTFEGQTACFLELYPRTYANGRKAYIGYGSANTTNLDILNQDTGLLRLGTNNKAKCHVTDDGFRVGIADNDYKRLRIGGGNSEGSIYGSFNKYGDGVHFGYNYYSLDSSFVIPQQTSSGTSRISCGYGTIGLHTGGTNTEPANNSLFINSSGNIGIGTTTPQKQLDVFNSACIGSPTAGSNSVFSIGSGINEYPPIALSANATTISGQNYANGSYTASASSTFSASFPEWRAFDKVVSSVWASSDNSYGENGYTGATKTTYNTNLEYLGEWIQIQLPIAVILKYFTITAVNTDSPAAPKNFAVFGSTIGSTWTLVSTLITGEIFTQGQVKSYVTSNTTEYKYYRLAINSKNNTTNNFVNLAEWRIYGYQNGTTNQLTVLPENVGIGTNTPSSSAILDITSTTKGFLMPRMTSTQVASITSPAEGLIVYDTTSDTFRYHNGTEWVYITPSGSSLFTTGSIPFANSSGSLTQNNSQLFWDNTNSRLGVGTNTPSSTLEVTRTAGGSTSPYFQITQSADTTITASTEAPSVRFNLSSTRTWANGSIQKQRFMLVNAPTIAFSTTPSSTVTDIATVAIDGAPKKGTNATLSNTHALLIEASDVSTATASYGLTCNAQSGATNNYAAAFLGGNVGIGTNTPSSSAILDITSTTKGFLMPRMTSTQVTNIASPSDGLIVYDTTSDTFRYHNGTEWVYITPSGSSLFTTGSIPFANSSGSLTQNNSQLFWDNTNSRLGIGTSTPSSLLNIKNTSGNSITLDGLATTPIISTRRKNGTDATPLTLSDTNVLGGLYTSGYNTTTSGYIDGAQIRSIVDGSVSTNDMPSALVLYTTPSGSAGVVERMRIDKNGNVGIGTTSPSQKLDVNGTLKTIGFDSRQVRKRAQYDISTADWYTIAKNGPINNTTTTGAVRGSAHFVVHDSSNSNHGVVEFVVITQFNGTSVLELERSGAYGNENSKWGKIQGIRIAGGGTYMGSIIEIQIESSTNLRIDMRSTVYDNITNDSSTENGWDLYSTVTQVDYSTWTNWAIRSTIDFTALTSDTVIKQLNYGSSALTTLTRNGNVGIGTSTPSSTLEVTRTAGSSTSPYFQIIQSADTAITTATEAPSVRFNLSSTRTWANGNITKQRFMLVNAPTITFTNPTPASTVTDIATVAIDGAPKKGTNATLTNTHALLIEAGNVSTASSSYGLTCNAQTGATNNYAAAFLGGNVGIGTNSPNAKLDVFNTSNTSAPVVQFPPLPLTSNSTTITSNITPIQGLYKVTPSSTTSSTYDGFKAFDRNDNTTNTWISQISMYNTTSGAYIGTRSLNGISGEYIILECPIPMQILRYRIKNRLDTTARGDPKTIYLLGSMDNTNWTQLDTESSLSSGNCIYNPISGFYSITTTSYFKYFALVVTETTQTGTTPTGALSINDIEYIGIPQNTPYLRVFEEETIHTLPFTPNGELGIGTSIPNAKLHIDNTSSNNLNSLLIEYSNSNTTNTNTYLFLPSAMTDNSTTYTYSDNTPLNGTYIASASSVYDGNPTFQPYLAFDSSDSTSWLSYNGSYDGSTGNYLGGNSLTAASGGAFTGTFNGEYIILETPKAFKLTSYRFKTRNNSSSRGDPKVIYLYGSNDKSTWYGLDSKTSGLTTASNTFNGPYTVTTSSYYKYFSLLISQTTPANLTSGWCSISYIEYTGISENNVALRVRKDIESVQFFPLSTSGNVGIGTTTPTSRLHIEGNTFLNGSVGIGTSTPVSVLNLKYVDNITSSYQYPPIGMTSSSQTVTGMDFYFNGTYTVTVSSNFAQSPGTYNPYTGVAYGPFSTSGDLLAWFCLSSRYTTTTVGTYTGTNSITNVSGSQTTISGEWIKLKIPSTIVLTSYKLVATYTLDGTGTPRTWAILGSNDGTNWDTLDNRLSSPLGPFDYNIITFTVTNTNAYTYFAFIVNTINNGSSGNGSFGVDRLELYGSPKSPAFLVENEATEPFQPFTIDYKGNVGIGIPAPLYTLHLSTDKAAKTASTTWTVTSDQRLKENILKADLDICYNNVKNITLHRFRYRDDLFNHNQIHDRSRLGWIAQEVEFLFPKAVTKQSQYGYDDCRSLDVDQLYASMYGCVQKLIEYNESNINRITDLENRYNLLKSENDEKNVKIIELENKIVNIEMQYELLLNKLKVVIPDF